MANKCSFCGETGADGRRIYPNDDGTAAICSYCIDMAYALDGFITNYRSGVIVRIVAGYTAHTLLVVSSKV